MKKFLPIFMVLILVFTFVSCSSKEYVDVPVTEVVTDENGETVTDESGQAVVVEVTDKDGNVVTERIEKSKTTTASESASVSSADSNTTAKNGTADGATNAGTTTTKKQNTNNTTTTKKQTTTKKTTTTTKPTKPQKRDIAVKLKLPFYNGQETEITVSYKVDGDKKYKKLDPVKTKLDETNKEQDFVIENVKGEVTVSVSLSGVEITQNTKVVKADENAVVISPVTGIEILEDMD